MLAKLAEEALQAMLLTSRSTRPGSRASVEGQMSAALGARSKLGQLAMALQAVFVRHAQKVAATVSNQTSVCRPDQCKGLLTQRCTHHSLCIRTGDFPAVLFLSPAYLACQVLDLTLLGRIHHLAIDVYIIWLQILGCNPKWLQPQMAVTPNGCSPGCCNPA